MQVLQCVRLLSRDEALRRKLDADALQVGSDMSTHMHACM